MRFGGDAKIIGGFFSDALFNARDGSGNARWYIATFSLAQWPHGGLQAGVKSLNVVGMQRRRSRRFVVGDSDDLRCVIGVIAILAVVGVVFMPKVDGFYVVIDVGA